MKFEERGYRKAFLGVSPEVFGWFGPFNMGKYLFWYSWFKRVKIKNEKIELFRSSSNPKLAFFLISNIFGKASKNIKSSFGNFRTPRWAYEIESVDMSI